MTKTYTVNAAPAMSLRPVRMRMWKAHCLSASSALSLCVGRVKKYAQKGETWRFTAHREGDAASRTVTYR